MPCKILTAGGVLLGDTSEEVLQGIVTENYGDAYLVRIQILAVPAIGHNLFLVKTATRKGIVSIFNRGNSRLEAFDATLHLWENTTICTRLRLT